MFGLSSGAHVEFDGDVLRIDSPAVGGVFAVLLLEEGRFIQTSRIAEAIWDDPPASAQSNVRLYLSRIRRSFASIDPALAERVSTWRGGGYAIKTSEDEFDLARFRAAAESGDRLLRAGRLDAAADRLRTALRMWKGPAGHGCRASTALSLRFASWNDLNLATLDRLAHIMIVRGNSSVLIPELQERVAAAPFREASWANLIRAFYLSGEVSGALINWNRMRDSLHDEYGISPSREMNRLRLSIETRDADAVRDHIHPGAAGTDTSAAGDAPAGPR